MWKKTILAAALMGVWATSWSAEVLNAVKVPGSGPMLDPGSSLWNSAKAVNVTMLPQMVTTPKHMQQAVKQMQVRAVHNGQWLAFLVEWRDDTKNDRLVTDEFGDQVAVELPVQFRKEALPSPMMGNPGGRVNVLQWRAAFQRDLEQGEPEVRTLYPNAVVDLYPDQVLRVTDARPYMGGLGLDNPVSRPKDSPVLDQMAEGWGTMTVKPDQHADGRGIWKDGMWHVTITLPLATESINAPRLSPGDQTVAAFAVWDGGTREVGSRKSWSDWVPLILGK